MLGSGGLREAPGLAGKAQGEPWGTSGGTPEPLGPWPKKPKNPYVLQSRFVCRRNRYDIRGAAEGRNELEHKLTASPMLRSKVSSHVTNRCRSSSRRWIAGACPRQHLRDRILHGRPSAREFSVALGLFVFVVLWLGWVCSRFHGLCEFCLVFGPTTSLKQLENR